MKAEILIPREGMDSKKRDHLHKTMKTKSRKYLSNASAYMEVDSKVSEVKRLIGIFLCFEEKKIHIYVVKSMFCLCAL